MKSKSKRVETYLFGNVLNAIAAFCSVKFRAKPNDIELS